VEGPVGSDGHEAAFRRRARNAFDDAELLGGCGRAVGALALNLRSDRILIDVRGCCCDGARPW